ncbi:DUF6207 family protein [Streptomyces sp. NBC_01221]|uniref:DUF6207 family protein n=1 Tax=Streptomyces sp. NBC_01221 TaxID=2903782 RepID=UPI00224D861C|nr:DUF6207 family protein [Streptomyces sp. NBC_01221]MCX4792251.1 DUF6207 family protein [Streptomyces sp. NBC_01221]
MEQIAPLHVSETGLLVVDLTAADEETVQAAIDALGRRWATSGGGRIRRVPGEPGVTARLYADIRRPGCEGAAAPD